MKSFFWLFGSLLWRMDSLVSEWELCHPIIRKRLTAWDSSSAVNPKMWICPLLLGSFGYRLWVYSHFICISYFVSRVFIYYLPFRQKSFLRHVKLEFSFSLSTLRWDILLTFMSSSGTSWCSCKPATLFWSMFMLKEGLLGNVPANDLLSLASLSEKGCECLVLRDSFQTNVLITWHCKM